MHNQPTLAIYALGPAQVFREEQLLTGWAYLDSAELLFYLLHHTRKPKHKAGQESLQTEDLHGKTKEQIGLELWPDASPQQLSSKLKSRLYDLRRVLGDGEWIVFEDGQYKFNATRSYWFDVEDFAAKIAEAERLRSKAPAQAIAGYQAAVQLYRGDFLADLRQRRARKEPRFDEAQDGVGREWLIIEQEDLLGAYLDALHKLGKLLVAAGSFEPAAEAYRLAVLKDDYDDDAHHGLMYCLALQGKRSQALEQYRRLLKRRGDTPPGPEMVELAERLKRGEELAPKPAVPAVAPPLSPEIDRATSAPFQVPTDLPRFVGRELELGELGAAVNRAELPRLFWLAGMGGIGKTSLAVHLAHALRDQFVDGVLWAHVSTSEPLAVLDSWARAFGCDFSGLPDLDSRAAALRAVLADKKALMILDDVWDAARARSLLVGGPQSTVLMTGRDLDLAEALDAQIVAVPVFAAEESQQLLARTIGQARVGAELAEAEEICQLLGHLPLALDIAAHRLASRRQWSLRELADRLRVQHQRLAELKIGDQEVRASFAVSWEALDEPLRRVFALLGVFAGRAFMPAALGAVAELDERAARDRSDSLVALSLLSVADSAHYRQHPLLADFAREHLEGPVAAEAQMAQYYLRYATEQRQTYLALEQEWDNLAAGLEVAHQQKMWQVIIDYGDVLTNAWFARGRYGYARQVYPLVCGAARELEEQDAYIAATINWGRACIEQGDYDEAKERLLHALQTSREVSDQHGMARAQFHLGRVALEQSNHDEARKLLEESQQLFERLGDSASIGNALLQRARIEYRHHNVAEVERLGKRALDLLRTTGEYEQTIAVLRFLALAAAHQGQHALADQYCREAMRLCEDGQYEAELPSVLYAWMQVCYRRGDYDLARQYGEKSITHFKVTGDRKSQSAALEYLVRVYLDLRDYVLAEARSRQSLALSQELRDDWGIVYALRGMGKLFNLTNRQDDARRVWTEALFKAQTLNHPAKEEIRNLLRIEGN
jgi:DNA-binding SARP family transcriptional activator